MIVNFVNRHEMSIQHYAPKKTVPHLGAVMADCILQAGLNYQYVVHPRVNRILAIFPEARFIDGVMDFLRAESIGCFLQWEHREKIDRFAMLARCLYNNEVTCTTSLQQSLIRKESLTTSLLAIRGIGEKTVDYLGCLVGVDTVAVDRHVRTFAQEAGVSISEYARLKDVICCAADLLHVRRRDFDSFIWQRQSHRARSPQLERF